VHSCCLFSLTAALQTCVFGTQTSGILKKLKALFHKDMIQFMKRSSKYLQERLPLRNTFLFSVQCLKLSIRRNPDSIQMMKQLAASVPHMACEMNFLDLVSTEWRLYQVDADIPLTTEIGRNTEWPCCISSRVLYWSRVASHTEGWSR